MNQKLTELAKDYKAIRDRVERSKEQLKTESTILEEYETKLLEAMVDEGVSSLKIDGVGLISMRTKSYLSVNAGNKPEFFEYLKESGNDGILKLDVNTRTLTAFLGDHLEHLVQTKILSGVDEFDARNAALEYLKSKGASFFSERGISLRQS